MRLLGEEELFTDVIPPEADGTNNESERRLRAAAQDRRTGRTSKTERGARRRTVITSVLDSLRLYLPQLTRSAVQEELERRRQAGVSRFGRLVPALQLPAAKLPNDTHSTLELLIPLCNTA